MEKRLVKVAPYVLDLEDPPVDDQAGLFAANRETSLKLDENETSLPPSPHVLGALRLALEDKPLNLHPDMKSRRLRRKLAQYTNTGFDSIDCFADEAAVMETIARTYLYNSLDTLIAGASDSPFMHYAKSVGAQIIQAQYENQFEPKIEELIASITPKTRMIYIDNPNGITGAVFTEAELVFLLSYAEDIMVVIDETYFEFCGISVADLIEKYANLMVIRSFGRTFSIAGVGVVYLLSDPANLRFTRRLSYRKYPNTLAQIAAESALDDLNYVPHINDNINASKKMIFETLTRVGYEFHISPVNFMILKAAEPDNLAKALEENNIYVKTLAGIAGFEDYIRLSIGTVSQTEKLLSVLENLAESQVTTNRKVRNRLTKTTPIPVNTVNRITETTTIQS